MKSLLSKWCLFPILILPLLHLSCSSSTPSSIFNFHYTGDGKELLIQEGELPSGWKLIQTESRGLNKDNNIWTATFDTEPDQYGTWSESSHSISVFSQDEEAAEFFDENYDYDRELFRKVTAFRSTQQEIEPPDEYSYKSPIAHQFKVLYVPEISRSDQIVGYRYEFLARYGNVVSIFLTVIEDQEATKIKAGEANVLPRPEVERLLKLIDDKFLKIGSEN